MTSVRVDDDIHEILLQIKKATGGRPVKNILRELVETNKDKYLKQKK